MPNVSAAVVQGSSTSAAAILAAPEGVWTPPWIGGGAAGVFAAIGVVTETRGRSGATLSLSMVPTAAEGVWTPPWIGGGVAGIVFSSDTSVSAATQSSGATSLQLVMSAPIYVATETRSRGRSALALTQVVTPTQPIAQVYAAGNGAWNSSGVIDMIAGEREIRTADLGIAGGLQAGATVNDITLAATDEFTGEDITATVFPPGSIVNINGNVVAFWVTADRPRARVDVRMSYTNSLAGPGKQNWDFKFS